MSQPPGSRGPVNDAPTAYGTGVRNDSPTSYGAIERNDSPTAYGTRGRDGSPARAGSPPLRNDAPTTLGIPAPQEVGERTSTGTTASHTLINLPAPLAERYESLEQIGGGGQAVVLRCRDREVGGDVAIKLYLGSSPTPDPDLIVRLQGCDPAHVSPILSLGADPSATWEIQEYFPLRGVANHLQDVPWEPRRVREFLREMTSALQHIHALSIAHRDLKPANVFVRVLEPLDVVLGDFGLSRQLELSVQLSTAAGTWEYMPPEAALVGETSLEGDWWALGVMVHLLLTGRSVFSIGHEGTVVSEAQIRSALYHGTYSLAAVTDPRWLLLVRGLLTHDREHRWGGREVDEWLAGGSPTVYQGGPARPRWTAQPIVFLGIVCATPEAVASVVRLRPAEAGRYLASDVSHELQTWLHATDVGAEADLVLHQLRGNATEFSRGLVTLQLLLSPEQTPAFAGRELTGESLASVAAQAKGGEQAAGVWIGQLRSARALTAVSQLVDGSHALAQADERLRMWWDAIGARRGQLGPWTRLVADQNATLEGLALAAALADGPRQQLVQTARQLVADAPSPIPENIRRGLGDAASLDVAGALVASVVLPAWRVEEAQRLEQQQVMQREAAERERVNAVEQRRRAQRNRVRVAGGRIRSRLVAEGALVAGVAATFASLGHSSMTSALTSAAVTLALTVAAQFGIDWLLGYERGPLTWFFALAGLCYGGSLVAKGLGPTQPFPSNQALTTPWWWLVVGYGVGSLIAWVLAQLPPSYDSLPVLKVLRPLTAIPIVVAWQSLLTVNPALKLSFRSLDPAFQRFAAEVMDLLPSVPAGPSFGVFLFWAFALSGVWLAGGPLLRRLRRPGLVTLSLVTSGLSVLTLLAAPAAFAVGFYYGGFLLVVIVVWSVLVADD